MADEEITSLEIDDEVTEEVDSSSVEAALDNAVVDG